MPSPDRFQPKREQSEDNPTQQSESTTRNESTPGFERRHSDVMQKRIGKYRILKKLGEGGMGAVYLARDTELGRDVALKAPKLKGTESRHILDRFLREARMAASLSHPGICPIYEFGEADGVFFLSMAYIEGMSLSQFLRNGRSLAPRQAALLVRRLALAVAAAHKLGIVHRDLKPGNIMIDRKGQPIVMDFGLARRNASDDTRLTRTGAFVGTPAYVSPEQITNRRGEVDCRTDIYSLGVILYEILAQRLPYEADNALNMLAQVLTGTPDSPVKHNPDACPLLSRIAMKAMCRNVTDRYQTMEDLAADLTAFLRGNSQPPGETGDISSRQAQEIDAEDIGFLNFDLAEFGVFADPTEAAPKTLPSRKHTSRGDRSVSSVSRDSQPRQTTKASQQNAVIRGPWTRPRIVAALLAAVMLPGLAAVLMFRTSDGRIRLSLTDGPQDVTVTIDGKSIPLDSLKSGYRFPAGPHAMIVRATGFEPLAREFTVASGQDETIVVTLTRPGNASTVSVRTRPPADRPDWLQHLPMVTAGGSHTGTVADDGSSVRQDGGDASVTPVRPDIVFADFEDGTYDGWTATGPSFAVAPQETEADTESIQCVYSPLNGRYAADSYFVRPDVGHCRLTGRLVSRPFRIERNYIIFLAAGHDPNQQFVRLIVDGEVQRSSAGSPRSELVFMPVVWDVREYAGKTATIEVCDESTDERGRISVDQFVFSDFDRSEQLAEETAARVRGQSIAWNGRSYFVSRQKCRFVDAAAFAEYVGGTLLQIDSEEERSFIIPHLKGQTWLGVLQQNGVWRGTNGSVYTHVDWRLGFPDQPFDGHMHLAANGDFTTQWELTRHFVVEFGQPQQPPPYTIRAAEKNRQLAVLLSPLGADLVVATSQAFHWLRPDQPLPDEPFEIRQVSFATGTRLSPSQMAGFEGIANITSLCLNDCDESALELLRHMPNLRRLLINGGQYQWIGLQHLRKGHPLRVLELSNLSISGPEVAACFRAERLETVTLTFASLKPALGSLLAQQADSLKELWLNSTSGFGSSGFRELRALKHVRKAVIFGSGVVDGDLKAISQMVSLTNLNLGANHGLRGTELSSFGKLESLQILNLWDCPISDMNLRQFPALPRLRDLRLNSTSITGAGLQRLTMLPQLQIVSLTGCLAVGDNDLATLKPCQSLMKLDVENTGVTSAGIEAFRKVRPWLETDVFNAN